MFKNLIILSESSNLYSTKRFLEESKKLKLRSKNINPFLGESIQLDTPLEATNALILNRLSGVRYDDYDLVYLKAHTLKNSKISNPLNSISDFRNKDSQLLKLKACHLPIIPSITFRGDLNTTIKNQLIKLTKDELYVLKTIRGNKGIGVSQINGTSSLFGLLETFSAIKDQRFIIQKFVKIKNEYRVLLTRDKILGILEKKSAKNDFRRNSSRSEFKICKHLPQNFEQLLLSKMTELDLDYAGIDLYIDEKNHFGIIEVNIVPGFEAMEKLLNINIAREIIISNFNL